MRSISVVGIFFVLLCIISTVSMAQVSGIGNAVETFGQGTIDWTSGQIFATGIGAPPANAVNPAQARAMAVRAAQVVALRNLLEIVKGVRVDSESIVENFMTRSDVIRTQVDGIVRGATIVKTSYLSDGSVEVTVGLGMRGSLLDAVVPETFGSRNVVPVPWKPVPGRPAPTSPSSTKPVPATPQPSPDVSKTEQPKSDLPKPDMPKPAPSLPQPEKQTEPIPPAPGAAEGTSSVRFKGGKATGVVIDGRGLGLRPALLPRIVDTQGQEIYVGQVVTRTNAVEQGVAGYAKDVNAAANNFRVTDNPAVLRGLRASGAAKTDIVLNQADAQTLRDLSRQGDFLQYCRVIIVY